MGYKEMYEEWLNNPCFDEETKKEFKFLSKIIFKYCNKIEVMKPKSSKNQ